MERNMDLVRQILLYATEQEHGYFSRNPAIVGFTEEQVDHHVYLMNQAGLVKAVDTSGADSQSPTAILQCVNWAGHDFINAARNDTNWTIAKEKAKSAGVAMTFDMLKELLISIARNQLGL